MDIREVRLARLLDLLAEEGGRRNVLAARIKKSPSQLSQWLGRHRTITEDSAREIEANAKNPPGWLDAPTPSPATPEPSSPDLAQALPVVLDAIAASPDRAELERLLPLLVTGAPAYRQRVAELLAQRAAPSLPAGLTETQDFAGKAPAPQGDAPDDPDRRTAARQRNTSR